MIQTVKYMISLRYMLCTAFMLTSCTAQLREDVDRLDASLSDLRSSFAETQTQLSMLQGEIRSLKGKTEEIEYSQNQKIGTEVDSLRSALSSLKRRVPPPSIVPSGALDDDENIISSFPPELASRFSSSLQMIREGNFADAIPALQSVLDASSGQSNAAYLLFWLGVCYDGLQDNRNALLAYNQVTSVYTGHPRVPLSLLRQASVFGRLGDSNAQSLTLKKLINEFPKTQEAQFAKQKLRR
jgi:TolA-binding protein